MAFPPKPAAKGKAPPFVAAKKGPKGAAAVGKTPAGNPFAAAKKPPFPPKKG